MATDPISPQLAVEFSIDEDQKGSSFKIFKASSASLTRLVWEAEEIDRSLRIVGTRALPERKIIIEIIHKGRQLHVGMES